MYRALQVQRACRAGFSLASRRSANLRVLSAGVTRVPVSGSFVKLQNTVRTVGPARAGPLLFCRRGYADLPVHKVVSLPALSPTMETGTIVSWEMEEGAEVAEGDALAQVETDKATMDMETPREGYLAKILVPAGTKDIPLGTPLCIMVEEEADIAAFKDYEPPAVKAATPPAQPAADTPSAAPATPPPPPASMTPPPPPTSAAPLPSSGVAGRIFASPYAKSVASAQGVDVSNVQGTGADGRVVSRDILAAASSPAVTVPSPAATVPSPAAMAASYTDLDLSNMRKTIARRLQESKQNIPHYYLTMDINMTKTLAVRQAINASQQGVFKLSPNDFVIKAAALALHQVPEANASWMETFIRQHHNVDICVAVSTDGGLITPIVFSADNKGLRAINQDVMSLAEKARIGKLQPEEYVGGTFTISNLGMYGVKQFTAIINPPQSCILAVGAVEKRVVPSKEDGESDVADMMTVTMSCDHRVVDGAVGAQWLASFKRFLEEPTNMLL